MKPKKTIRQPKHFSYQLVMRFILISITFLMFFVVKTEVNAQYLSRTLSDINNVKIDISTQTAHYKPIFGAGDDNSGIIKAATRFGNLTIDPKGNSNIVKYDDEEQILFIIDGTGILSYGKEKVPVSKNDFIYIPVGTKFGFSNPRDIPVSVIVMGFKIFPSTVVKPTSKLMIANTSEVQFQVVGNHDPTTTFQLLMGTTESERDKLAVAYQVTSLFIMDFAENGTNNVHRHRTEEEIYLIIRGHGEIVAGAAADGTGLRHPAKKGDAYFFAPNTLVGFYSGNKGCEEHAQILAVRFKYPVQPDNQPQNK